MSLAAAMAARLHSTDKYLPASLMTVLAPTLRKPLRRPVDDRAPTLV